MKKYSVLLSAVVAIAALVSCNKEIAEPVKIESEGNVPFVLKADIPQTKLALADDWSLNWEDGDVIYAVTTDEEWGKAYTVDKNGETIAEFVCKDGDFTTEKTISDKEHTFNFLYAPESQKSYHRGASTTYKIPGTQAQDCSVPTAGIKNYYPLAGQVTVTTPADDITADMSHLATIVKVTLKNPTKENLAITSFSISMPDANIAGVFPIAFGETPAFTQEGAKSVSSSVTVNLTNGTVAAGAELPVYVVLAPVANYSGKITMTATDSMGLVYEKTNTVSALSFEAGTYNTASFSLKDGVKPDYLIANGNYAILAKDGDSFYALSSQPNGTSKRRDRLAVSYDGGSSFETSKSELVWSFTLSNGTYTIACGEEFMTAAKNTIPLGDSEAATTVTIVKNNDGTYTLTADCGDDGTRFMAMNGANGFGWYAEATGTHNMYVVPVTVVEPTYYTITVSPATNGTVTSSKEKAEAGETITVTVTPDTGYELATLTANDFDIKDAKTFIMPAEDVTIEATFDLKEDSAQKSTILDFTLKTAGNSNYANSWDYGNWKIVNGANNNKGWDYVKMGGKNTTLADANPCYIYNTVAISHSVSKITVELPSGSLSKSGMSVNSWGVYVYSDEEMTTQIDYVAGGTISNSAGSFDFVPSAGKTWASGYFYKVIWDLANSSTTNGIVCVSKITLSEK